MSNYLYVDMETGKFIISEVRLTQLITNLILETLACLGGEYRKRIRFLCHLIKDGDMDAIDEASVILSKYVPPGSVLIPVPSHNGYATYTLTLANFIAKRSKSKVMDILSSPPRERMYNLKFNKGDVENIDLQFSADSSNKEQIARILKGARNVILIDNVVSSGITYEQAQKALKKMYGVDAWMLSLGAVTRTPYDRNEKRVLRSTF